MPDSTGAATTTTATLTFIGAASYREQQGQGLINFQRSNRSNVALAGHAGAGGSDPTAATVPALLPAVMAAQPTEDGYGGNIGFPCVAAASHHYASFGGAHDVIEFLVDSGASGHYLDSNLVPDAMSIILKDYAPSQHPAKIIGAGGHEFWGIGEGTITVLAEDEHGVDRCIRLTVTIVPGLGRHLFSTGAAYKKGADTQISEFPRIEVGPQAYDRERREIRLGFLGYSLLFLECKDCPVEGHLTNGSLS